MRRERDRWRIGGRRGGRETRERRGGGRWERGAIQHVVVEPVCGRSTGSVAHLCRTVRTHYSVAELAIFSSSLQAISSLLMDRRTKVTTCIDFHFGNHF